MAAAAFWQTRLGGRERYLSGTGFTFGIAILLSICCGPDLLGNCSQKKGGRRSFQLAWSDVKEYTMRFAKKCYSGVTRGTRAALVAPKGLKLRGNAQRRKLLDAALRSRGELHTESMTALCSSLS